MKSNEWTEIGTTSEPVKIEVIPQTRVLYGSALTGGAPIVDESPGAGHRFWQAMIDSVTRDIERRADNA